MDDQTPHQEDAPLPPSVLSASSYPPPPYQPYSQPTSDVVKEVAAAPRSRFNPQLLLVAVALLAGIVAAYVVSTTVSSKATTPTISNAELVRQAVANMRQVRSYHLELEGEATGMQITMTAEVDLADNSSRGQMSAMGERTHFISVKGRGYQSSDGQTFVDSGNGDTLNSLTGMWTYLQPKKAANNQTNLKDGEPAHEQFGDVVVKHIVANAADFSGLFGASDGAAIGTLDLWISTDQLPTVRQLRLDGTVGGQKMNVTMKWSRFNEQFRIEPPQNVQ